MFLFRPPTSPLNYIADGVMVIAGANIEFELLGLFGFYISIFLI